VLLLLPVSQSQEPPPDDELAMHLANLKQQIGDMSLPMARRENLAIGMAGTLDRAAQTASSDDQRQARWAQAIELLDSFNTQNPGHARAREFQLQAAVYRWAQGRVWRGQSELNPAEPSLRQQAMASMDDAVTRLRAISAGEAGDVLGDNLRFRLARALADRAELESGDTAQLRAQQADALDLLGQPISEPGLKGFAALLKADLLRRANRADEAMALVDDAAKSEPALPEREILDVRIPVLTAQKKFDAADAALRTSHLDEPIKEMGLFQVRLAELSSLAPGADKFPVEKALFRELKTLRDRKVPESRLALADLAQSGIDPDSRHEPEVWDILAEAHEVVGDAQKAGALEEQAALRALALGRPDAARFRLRGGGFLFQAGKYVDADDMLSKVIADPKGGALRAKASMLRGLARGRALAAGLPGITPAAYAQALDEQVRDFPDDPATDEARWLLGSLARASGDSSRAEASWSAIPHGSARWLDARLALAEIKRTALESHLVAGDHHALTEEYQSAHREISETLRIARSEAETIELSLALARFDLVPGVGHPQPVVALTQRIQRMNLTPLGRYRARLLYTIAQCQVGRYVEAEREAQNHASWAEPSARETFLDAVSLLDQSAASSEMDLPQRRFGMVLRLLIQPLLRDAEADSDNARWTSDQRAELQMRLARALLYLGDDRGARMALRGWAGPPRSLGDALLRDLADTYNRLEAYELAIDVERLRAKALTTGSPAWFDARYGLALAYFHAGRQKEAAQLIDATAILHPELGGGTLQKKFIRLRQRLGVRS
jgi:hypothetical protein